MEVVTPKWNLPGKIYGGISLLLLLAAMPLPYGYYTFLRLVVCSSAVVVAYQNFESKDQSFWPWLWCLVAIIFNPFVPIGMSKILWAAMDIATSCLFGFLAYKTLSRKT